MPPRPGAGRFQGSRSRPLVTAVPTSTDPARTLRLAHLRAQLERDGMPAVYRVAGSGDGVVISAMVIEMPADPRPARPGAGAGNDIGGRPTFQGRTYAVEVPACEEGEGEASPSTGVSASGGIVKLTRGDTITVRGERLGRPAGEIALVVGRGISCDGISWTAEVTA